jgi:hypothetical protein
MLILALFLALAALIFWTAVVTIPAIYLGRVLATALVRLIK